uniref:Uncharacterized protein n=1 Tax=Magallana gigas TaxID=29159 RepID=K1R096_MAGGI
MQCICIQIVEKLTSPQLNPDKKSEYKNILPSAKRNYFSYTNRWLFSSQISLTPQAKCWRWALLP